MASVKRLTLDDIDEAIGQIEPNPHKEFVPTRQVLKHRSPLIPDGYCATIIVGARETGKTSVLPRYLSLLAPYQNLFLFTIRADQPTYKYLIEQAEAEGVKVSVYNTLDPLSLVRKREYLRSCKHNLVIIDDFINDLEKMTYLYTAGRWDNISVITVIQKYTLLPITIRANVNQILLFPLQGDTKHTLSAMPDGGMVDYKRIKSLYKEMVSEPIGSFLYFCCSPTVKPILRIRKGFDGVLSDLSDE